MPNGGNVHFVDRCPYCKSSRIHEISRSPWLFPLSLLLPGYKCRKCKKTFYSPTEWKETVVQVKHKAKHTHKHHRRLRATAVVFRGNKVLLVRDRGKHHYSLPGGALKRGEHTVNAATRELYEELGLNTISIQRLRKCDFKGSASEHRVCLIEIIGEPRLKSKELDKFIWWDMEESIPIYTHVTRILKNVQSNKL